MCIKDFSQIAKPLTTLTRKDTEHLKAKWGVPQHEAFERLKQKLVEAPVSAFHIFYIEVLVRLEKASIKCFMLETEASSKKTCSHSNVRKGRKTTGNWLLFR